MKKKLKFSKETLKTLTEKELSRVVGGAVPAAFIPTEGSDALA
jgi:bacteriocin-like protein